ncbi:hypothetical protein P3X46_002552, partial [Hevea brasiliensis]
VLFLRKDLLRVSLDSKSPQALHVESQDMAHLQDGSYQICIREPIRARKDSQVAGYTLPI